MFPFLSCQSCFLSQGTQILIFPKKTNKLQQNTYTISHLSPPTKILPMATDINLANGPHCYFLYGAILDLLFLPEENSYNQLFYKGRIVNLRRNKILAFPLLFLQNLEHSVWCSGSSHFGFLFQGVSF